MTEQTILDMCCGSRMFWFDKQDERAVFSDIHAEQHKLCDGRSLVISPDIIADFRALPFADASFPIVVFDPPHLERVGENAWMGKKYGRLNKDTWRDDLRAGFVNVTTYQPLPVVLKEHQIRELVNKLRDIAIEYHSTQQLREHIACVVRAAMIAVAQTAPKSEVN